MRVRALIDELECCEDNAQVVVNLCGHSLRIAMVEATVNAVDILLLDDIERKCSYTDVIRSEE